MVIDCFQLSKRKGLLKKNSKLKVGPKKFALAFSSAENFSYVPLVVAVRLSIMVSTAGFTSSLIASIREAGMVCVKDPLELGKIASLLPRLYYLLSHVCQL